MRVVLSSHPGRFLDHSDDYWVAARRYWLDTNAWYSLEKRAAKEESVGQRITPCLWFDMNAEEAIAFYAGIFEDVTVNATDLYVEGGYGPVGEAMYIEFTMNGREFSAINGGPDFRFNEAISLVIDCKDQEEVDHIWEKLGAGGEYGPCGWLKDKFGLSWQVTPVRLFELIRNSEPAKVTAVTMALLQMGKIDIAALEAAADAA